MKKKSNTRKFRFNANVLRNLLIVYAILASTLALFLMTQFYLGYQSQQKMFAETDFKLMVRNTMLSLYESPLRTAGGDSLYIPEVKLAIPTNPGEGKILYNYELAFESTPEDSTPETVTFASRSAIDSMEMLGDNFACQRLAVATFGTKNDYWDETPFEFVGDVKLDDGRSIFLYQNKQQSCERLWTVNSTTLIDQLKQSKTSVAN